MPKPSLETRSPDSHLEGLSRFHLGPFSVNRLGFGAMQLAGSGMFGPPRDRPEALAVLRDAVEAGVDHDNGIIHDFMMLNALSDTDSTRAAIGQAVAALRRAFDTALN
jgi:hypothetical protein